MDREYRILEFNPEAERLYGRKRADVLGKDYLELFLPDNAREAVAADIEKVLAGVPTREFENTVMTKDKQERILRWNVGRILDFEDKPAGVVVFGQDITERKQVEEALRESEEKYRSLVEQSLQGIIIFHDFQIVFANPTAAKIAGLTLEEALALSPEDIKAFIPVEERATVLQRFEGRLAGMPVQHNYELRLIRQNGNEFWLDVFISQIEYLGKFAIQVAFIDITERKQAEESLRESEEKLRLMSVHMYDYVMMLDLEFNIQFVNRAGKGLTIAQLIGKPPYIHVGKDEQSKIQKKLKEVVETGETSFYETEYHRQDGRIIYFESIASPIFVDDKITGIVVSSRDITDRKEAEKALQQSEERLKILFESAPDGIYLNDLKGNFVDGNKAAEEIIGYTREELIGKSFLKLNLLPSYQVPKAVVALAKNATGKPTGPDEFTLKRKDGSYITVEIRTFPVRIENQTLVLGIARDIGERKKAEEAVLEERDRAQKYLDVAAVMFVALGAQGDVTLVNKKGCELLGWDEPEIVGKNWFDNFLPEGIRKEVKAVFEKIMAGVLDPVEYFENPILTKNGDKKIIAWHNTTLRTEQGEIIGTLSSGEDITEYKRARETLRENEMRFRLVRNLHLFDEKGKLLISVGVLDNSPAIVGICRNKQRNDNPIPQNHNLLC